MMLDVSITFDSVSHDSICRAAEANGTPLPIKLRERQLSSRAEVDKDAERCELGESLVFAAIHNGDG